MNNLLTIDYGKSNSSLDIFPCKPLLANQKDRGISIKIEHYQLPPHLAPKHIPLQNAIVIFHQPIKTVRRQLGEKYQTERIKTGDIVISPANVLHAACWEEPASFTLLLLERDFLARAAYEFKHPHRIELLPTFARPDPVIYQIGLALKTELDRAFLPNCEDFSQERPYQKMYLDTAAAFLATHLLTHYAAKSNLQDRAHALSGRDLGRVLKYIDSNFSCQNLGLTELADLVGLSERYFCEVFKQSTGISPYQYLINCRISKAAQLLVSTDLKICEIAKRTGFSSPTNFCRTFRHYRSVTAKEYRQG